MIKSRDSPMNMVKVRFAPSPTGTLHVGGVRTALFNYCFAKARSGEFILRIEDTDQTRKVEGAVEQIKESLQWLGVSWDSLVTQSERVETYKKYAEELVEKGLARKEDGAVRFLVNKTGSTSWTDAVGNKKISFENNNVEDIIILKKDGFPTYHLANVIDDHLMGITHVIRGDDWVSSTPKHIMLYKAFGWSTPTFAHVPNIFDTTGKKLSKRRGAKSVLDFKNEGILPEALFNYLMLLGWSPKDDRELLARTEIEKEFGLENINVSPAVFDEKKLLWMNGEYMRKSTISNLKFLISNFDPEVVSIPSWGKYVPLAQTRMKTLLDFKAMVVDSNAELSDKQKKLAGELYRSYSSLDNWNKDKILKVSFEVRDKLDCSTKDLYLALTGKPQGLPLFEKLEIEGKDKILEHLKKYT
jgi:glutamyl-tRNA synthetase